jgi:Ca2+-binding RTX toxin-like protein
LTTALDQGQLPGTHSLPATKLRMCSLERGVVLKAGEGVQDCPRPEHTKKSRGTDYNPQSEWVGREHHMRRIIVVLAAMAAMVVVYAGAALATSVSEVEPNDSIDQAQNIDGSFSLDSDPNIGNTTINTSTIVPHATLNGTGNGTVDYYRFTVSKAGDGVILDVDGAVVCNEEVTFCEGFDSWVELHDSSDQFLAANDDSDTTWGQGGSVAGGDSYLEYTFQTPGTYYVAVGRYHGLQPIPAVGSGGSGTSYQLQVSLGSLCQGQLPTIKGQSGRSTNGTKGDDVIAGTQGPDIINGGGGNDTICARDGKDSISGGAGNDNLSGGAGNDRIMGNQGSDSLFGEGDNDTLDGGLSTDYINGGDGTDKCSLGENGRDGCELAIGPNVNR